MPDLPSGTLTMLFTDVVGSTRLLQRLGDAYRPVIADHHRLLRATIQAYGHEVEDRGDGLFAVFTRAVDALTAAVAAQRALAAHPWPEGAAVQVRVGLHTGDPALVGNNYVGLDVHRAARLCDAAHGGQILVSAATRELVEQHLPEDVTLRDLGEHRLRDLQRPERIYQAVIADLPADFPPPRAVAGRPNNLPAARVSIIGRDGEVAAARDLLLREDVGLVTLTGPGGAGKTRLGLQIAAALLDRFEDGVYLVLLAPIAEPGLVPATIARALGLREAADRPVADVLADHLRERQVLLLLDNFEQILPAAPVVADLLAACPRLKILVTSRAALRVRSERELAVPPLGLPEDGASVSAERLQQYAAVALFAERAREVRPDFAITTENAPAVAEICQRLDGLPLAIELAAARIRLLSPQAMLGRLGRRLPFLTGGSRDLPARQQTLRDTIGWSYDLLSEEEQRLFRRLGVFVGGFTLEAAEAVGDRDGDLGQDLFDLVASLVDKSLVRQVDGPGAEPRFTMLETIREYGLEQLEASGESGQVRHRHAEHFAAFAEQAEPALTSADGDLWMERLEADHDNLRAALAWCDDASDDGRLHLLPRLANPVWVFWWQRGYWAEARRWYDRILDLPLSKGARLGALRGRGQLAVQGGEFARSVELWDEAITLSRELGNLAVLSLALGRKAYTLAQMGDAEGAWALADEALAVAQQLGERRVIGTRYMEIGHAARVRGDIEAARVAWETCLTESRETGAAYIVPYALQLLSAVAIEQGELDRASALAEEALPLFQIRDDRWGIQGVFSRLIRIAQLRGDRDRVASLAHENLLLVRSIGSLSSIADNLVCAAWVARTDGRVQRAAALLGASEVLGETIGYQLRPASRREWDAERELLRESLDDTAFEAAWEAGRALTVDQAMRYALEEIDVDPGGPRAWPS